MNLNNKDNEELLQHIIENFKIDINGYHGPAHWSRVLENTKKISEYYNFQSPVFELFAILHDSQRENENSDPYHGPRAAKWIQENRNNFKSLQNLTEDEFLTLKYACDSHSTPIKFSPSYIIDICHDSDRLDLGRVGISPCASYMNTNYSKSLCY